MPPAILISVDLATKNLAAATFGGIRYADPPEVLSLTPYTAKRETGIARSFEVFDFLSAYIQAYASQVGGNIGVAFEDTYFGMPAYASTGEVRGMLYSFLRGERIPWVNVPVARWRAYYGHAGLKLSKTERRALEEGVAIEMGAPLPNGRGKLTAAERQERADCVSAFMIGRFMVEVLRARGATPGTVSNAQLLAMNGDPKRWEGQWPST